MLQWLRSCRERDDRNAVTLTALAGLDPVEEANPHRQ